MPKPIAPDTHAQPKAMQELQEFHLGEDADGVVHLAEPSEEQSQRQRAHYYANVTMIDAQVGEIIEALEQRGVLDDTIIIFTSDHGDALGDHGHSQKWNMYQSTVHIPALVFGPGRIPEGRRVSDNVALFDFGPTILEYAGVPIPDWMEARSLVPYFEGEPSQGRNRVFAEHSNDALLTGTRFMTMILEDNMKLIHFIDAPKGMLFDLTNDPDEKINLWDEPAQTATRDRLIDEILNWRLESSMKTQGFLEACKRDAITLMSPPGSPARGQHREGSR